ncbi:MULTISPECIES: HAD family hydrolase [unclassified Paenibacillus]|uniref:HAD family hydrolase n=1 Tax=unclassified Paenibacillus TaxID=185978 RepID=UPI00095452CF|nr:MULTISPECIES: HAD family hydrolase [unclassified Paenibacillus]ASS65275.1 HAD family hydrolase [Paenibacillus sp. RUD330]SIQ41673.1 putative hydrolase of the HAD superfamily [Paenibacillus sp. RU4X]SIQ63884.1 putative hydrolase of the HAD superfamily [Paenibacillus sp. RU4T]
MAKKAVLFDLDDTLLWDERSVDEAFQATCEWAQEQSGADPKRLEAEVKREARELYSSYETFPFTQQIGINPLEGLWARFAEGELESFRKLEQLAPGYRKDAWTRGLSAVGIDDPLLGAELAERFPKERRERPIVYEETFEVLEALKGKYKLLLLTNGSPDLQQEKLLGVPELTSYFDEIVISGNYGKGKPDAGIFRHALELLGVDPEDGIMVGDKLTTDILGANTIGMTSVWINRGGKAKNPEIVPSHEITRLDQLIPLLA